MRTAFALAVIIGSAVFSWWGSGLAIVYFRGQSPTRSMGRPVVSTIRRDIYSNVDANDFVRCMFPQTVVPGSISLFLNDPTVMDRWQNLDDTFDGFNSFIKRSAHRPDVVDFGRPPLESYWLTTVNDPERAAEFLRENERRIQDLVDRMIRTDSLTSSVIEKSLLQRDAVQSFFIFHEANRALGKTHSATLDALAALVRKLLLSSSEYQDLRKTYPSKLSESHFTTVGAFDSEANYLPEAVLGGDTDWFPLLLSMRWHEHYARYQGRSFFSTYVRLPGVSHESFEGFKQHIEERIGRSVNVAADIPQVPIGTETMLVRTMGILLDDKTLCDSGIIEEVLIRAFSQSEATFDRKSSDFRGTYHRQYSLERHRLLNDMTSLGLVRIGDNAPAYLGIFPNCPDEHVNTGEYLTLSRMNCISCHSETYYGSNTVFSFGLAVAPDWLSQFLDNPIVQPLGPGKRVSPISEKFRNLLELME